MTKNEQVTLADLLLAQKETKEEIMKKMDELEQKIEERYVTKGEFEPVKKVVYGLVGAMLLAIVGALMSLALRS